MKKTTKFILFFIALAILTIITPNFSNAQRVANNEDTLNSEISAADPGETITIQNDITITKPIVIAKELTIDGNGHNIVGSNDWTSTSGNQTMFTAQLSDAKLTLKNIKLKNGPKYGVQSYDGATVILDNVSISGFKYGGVLANGGKVEVKNLHLGFNGTNANNGIEIDKGSSATNNPTLVMDGVLTSESNENVIYPAENGKLTDFTITNTQNTTNKVVISGNKVVLTDSSNNVISENNIPDKATPSGDIQKLIVTIVANEKTNKITVDSGKTITADLLKSYIEMEENYTIDGFYRDSNYTTEFNFDDPINTDTTVYVKISKVETPIPEEKPEQTPEEKPEQTPGVENQVKDETPKTGVGSHLEIAVLTISLATLTIFAIRNKSKRIV